MKVHLHTTTVLVVDGTLMVVVYLGLLYTTVEKCTNRSIIFAQDMVV